MTPTARKARSKQSKHQKDKAKRRKQDWPKPKKEELFRKGLAKNKGRREDEDITWGDTKNKKKNEHKKTVHIIIRRRRTKQDTYQMKCFEEKVLEYSEFAGTWCFGHLKPNKHKQAKTKPRQPKQNQVLGE